MSWQLFLMNPWSKHEEPRELSERIQREQGLMAFSVFQDSRGMLRLDTIVAPRGGRGGGSGSRAMQSLIDYADRRGKIISLTPAAKDPHHGTTSRARLVRFYKRFGFVENKGRRMDFTMRAGDMYRLPRTR